MNMILNFKILPTFILGLFLLSSCVTTESVYGPDGKEAILIDCSGEYITWGQCQAKAGELCQERGYKVIERDTDTGVSSSISGTGGSVFGSSSTTVTRTMMIRCN